MNDVVAEYCRKMKKEMADNAWRKTKPKSNESQIKQINNKDWKWCEKCSLWTLSHGTAEHNDNFRGGKKTSTSTEPSANLASVSKNDTTGLHSVWSNNPDFCTVEAFKSEVKTTTTMLFYLLLMSLYSNMKDFMFGLTETIIMIPDMVNKYYEYIVWFNLASLLKTKMKKKHRRCYQTSPCLQPLMMYPKHLCVLSGIEVSMHKVKVTMKDNGIRMGAML
jgi:hypothetical protein